MSVTKLYEMPKPRPKSLPPGKILVLIDSSERGEESVLGVFSHESSMKEWYASYRGRGAPDDAYDEIDAVLKGESSSDLQVLEMEIDVGR